MVRNKNIRHPPCPSSLLGVSGLFLTLLSSQPCGILPFLCSLSPVEPQPPRGAEWNLPGPRPRQARLSHCSYFIWQVLEIQILHLGRLCPALSLSPCPELPRGERLMSSGQKFLLPEVASPFINRSCSPTLSQGTSRGHPGSPRCAQGSPDPTWLPQRCWGGRRTLLHGEPPEQSPPAIRLQPRSPLSSLG